MHDNTAFAPMEIPLPGARPIQARRYGQGPKVVILSNMDTNDTAEWRPLVEAMAAYDGFAVVTYAYPEDRTRCEEALDAVVDFVEADGPDGDSAARRVVLVGAGRGGVISLRVAAKRGDERIYAVVALSAPMECEGEALVTEGDLRMLTLHKLLIASEFDDCVEGTRNIFALSEDPRQLTIYPGDAHGTALFGEHGDSLLQQLTEYIRWVV